jgi:GNAT superfamily N-acetyltransferase
VSLLTPDEAHLVEAIEGNQFALREYMARWPHMEVHHEPGLAWAMVSLPLAPLTLIWGARLAPAEVSARAGTVLARYAARSLPVQWLTGPSTQPPDLGRRLEEQGLFHEGDAPGLALVLSAKAGPTAAGSAPGAGTPAGLEIRRLARPSELPDWLAAFGGAGLPEPVTSALLDLEASLGFEPEPPYMRYVAYRAGRPLATASLFLAAGAAGIYNVFTLPEARGEGLGRALTLRALHDAHARGCTVAVLASSRLGLGLYRRLGFREHCRFGRYVRI